MVMRNGDYVLLREEEKKLMAIISYRGKRARIRKIMAMRSYPGKKRK